MIIYFRSKEFHHFLFDVTVDVGLKPKLLNVKSLRATSRVVLSLSFYFVANIKD